MRVFSKCGILWLLLLLFFNSCHRHVTEIVRASFFFTLLSSENATCFLRSKKLRDNEIIYSDIKTVFSVFNAMILIILGQFSSVFVLINHKSIDKFNHFYSPVDHSIVVVIV